MSDLPNTHQIKLFMHCAQCVRESRPQNIEAGWTPQGFQVWCCTHRCNIIHVDFEGALHPANTSRQPTGAEQLDQQKRENTH